MNSATDRLGSFPSRMTNTDFGADAARSASTAAAGAPNEEGARAALFDVQRGDRFIGTVNTKHFHNSAKRHDFGGYDRTAGWREADVGGYAGSDGGGTAASSQATRNTSRPLAQPRQIVAENVRRVLQAMQHSRSNYGDENGADDFGMSGRQEEFDGEDSSAAVRCGHATTEEGDTLDRYHHLIEDQMGLEGNVLHFQMHGETPSMNSTGDTTSEGDRHLATSYNDEPVRIGLAQTASSAELCGMYESTPSWNGPDGALTPMTRNAQRHHGNDASYLPSNPLGRVHNSVDAVIKGLSPLQHRQRRGLSSPTDNAVTQVLNFIDSHNSDDASSRGSSVLHPWSQPPSDPFRTTSPLDTALGRRSPVSTTTISLRSALAHPPPLGVFPSGPATLASSTITPPTTPRNASQRTRVFGSEQERTPPNQVRNTSDISSRPPFASHPLGTPPLCPNGGVRSTSTSMGGAETTIGQTSPVTPSAFRPRQFTRSFCGPSSASNLRSIAGALRGADRSSALEQNTRDPVPQQVRLQLSSPPPFMMASMGPRGTFSATSAPPYSVLDNGGSPNPSNSSQSMRNAAMGPLRSSPLESPIPHRFNPAPFGNSSATPMQRLQTPVIDQDNSLQAIHALRVVSGATAVGGSPYCPRYSPTSAVGTSPAQFSRVSSCCSPQRPMSAVRGSGGLSMSPMSSLRGNAYSSPAPSVQQGFISRPSDALGASDNGDAQATRASLTSIQTLQCEGISKRLDSNLVAWGSPQQMVVAIGRNVYRWIPKGSPSLLFQSRDCDVTAVACRTTDAFHSVASSVFDSVLDSLSSSTPQRSTASSPAGGLTYVAVGLDNGLIYVQCYNAAGTSLGSTMINELTSTITTLQIVKQKLYVGTNSGSLAVYKLRCPHQPTGPLLHVALGRSSTPSVPAAVPRPSTEMYSTPPRMNVPGRQAVSLSPPVPYRPGVHPPYSSPGAPLQRLTSSPGSALGETAACEREATEVVAVGSAIYRIDVTDDDTHIAVGTATGLLIYLSSCLSTAPQVILANSLYPVRALAWCPVPPPSLPPLCTRESGGGGGGAFYAGTANFSPYNISGESAVSSTRRKNEASQVIESALGELESEQAHSVFLDSDLSSAVTASMPRNAGTFTADSSLPLGRRLIFAGGQYGTVLTVYGVGHSRPIAMRETRRPILSITVNDCGQECVVSFAHPSDELEMFTNHFADHISEVRALRRSNTALHSNRYVSPLRLSLPSETDSDEEEGDGFHNELESCSDFSESTTQTVWSGNDADESSDLLKREKTCVSKGEVSDTPKDGKQEIANPTTTESCVISPSTPLSSDHQSGTMEHGEGGGVNEDAPSPGRTVQSEVPSSSVDVVEQIPVERSQRGAHVNPEALGAEHSAPRSTQQRSQRLRLHPVSQESADIASMYVFHLKDNGHILERGRALTSHSRSVLQMAVSPNNAYLASVGNEEKLHLWNVFARKKQQNSRPSSALSPDEYSYGLSDVADLR